MKPYLSLLIFCCLATAGFAQKAAGVATDIVFNKHYTECERKWVVLAKDVTDTAYRFGFIYLDSQAGFTFDFKGSFSVVGDKYKVDTTTVASTSLKYRIGANWKLVALLPQSRFKELGIPAEPGWVKNYYTYTDTVAHNYHWGWLYNDVGASAIAINYLEPAYRMSNKADSITFELGFSYNAVNNFKKAIEVLEPATQRQPDYYLFYKELGYAYLHLDMNTKAIETYARGLAQYPDKKAESRWELAYNMAQAYKKMGETEKYKEWMAKSKTYLPADSGYNKIMTDAGY